MPAEHRDCVELFLSSGDRAIPSPREQHSMGPSSSRLGDGLPGTAPFGDACHWIGGGQYLYRGRKASTPWDVLPPGQKMGSHGPAQSLLILCSLHILGSRITQHLKSLSRSPGGATLALGVRSFYAGQHLCLNRGCITQTRQPMGQSPEHHAPS